MYMRNLKSDHRGSRNNNRNNNSNNSSSSNKFLAVVISNQISKLMSWLTGELVQVAVISSNKSHRYSRINNKIIVVI